MKYILHTSYAPLCDFQWDTGKELPTFVATRTKPVVLHVPTDHIVEAFNLIDRSDREYIVVSSNSDYCVEEQENCPVEHDMQKWLRFINCTGIGYSQLNVPARCDVETCRKSDKYSVKVYSWTKDTFSKIPDNVLVWFGTNINIKDDRVVHIPFGVPQQSVPFLEWMPKTKFGIYCNWQNNTVERDAIAQMYKGLDSVVSEGNVPPEQFISRLKECPFTIAPPGNGLDSYRILEAIYCGSVPIIVQDIWSQAYHSLPAIVTGNYSIYDSVRQFWDSGDFQKMDFRLDNTPADLLYWQSAIETAKGA